MPEMANQGRNGIRRYWGVEYNVRAVVARARTGWPVKYAGKVREGSAVPVQEMASNGSEVSSCESPMGPGVAPVHHEGIAVRLRMPVTVQM